MSKNSDYAATMYESDPLVAALNKVPGFDPLKLMHRKGAAKEDRDLEFRYKKLWFRLAHREGRIRLNALKITDHLAIYEAQVYLDRSDQNPIGSFTATCTREEAANGKYIEGAQEKAMDQALTDAGFGLQFVPAPGEGAQSVLPQAAEAQKSGAGTQAAQTAVQSPAPAQTAVPSPAPAQAAVQGPAPAQAAVPSPVPAQAMPSAGTMQTAPSAGPMQAAKAAQGRQKEAPKPVQEKVAPPEPAPEPAPEQPASAEVLPAEQLPVNAVQQASSAADDVMAAMSMLTGKKEPDALPVTPEPAAPVSTAQAAAMPVRPAAPAAPTAAMPVRPAAPAAPTAATSETPQENRASYTDDMPVDEIRKQMTLEDARKVVVPVGTCAGWTLEKVAKDRAPSLKYYVSAGYTGNSNILRAAAGLMLEELEKKAG